jgi:hypothetical protein
VRTRPGTSSLRAILYMDEIFGFMPPVAEPPSKRPLLTLLKQARAYGLGVVLATQNPVDLDYKGLSNTGTWFLGRLQTERDKLRVLDGLEGVGTGFDRAATERLLSGLGKRVFLLHNVHEERPVLFRTRWAMSYLRGPLTRAQIRSLSGEVRSENASERPTLAEPADLRPTSPGPKPGATAAAVVAAEGAPGMAGGAGGAVAGGPPIVSPDIRQVFLPVDRYSGSLAYQPGILGLARVHYTNRSRSREVTEETALVLPALGGPDDAIAWQEATRVTLDCARLGDEPAGPARFASFGGSPTPETFRRGAKDFSEHLYRTSAYTLLRSPLLDELSEPGESEGDFRIRLGERARERRDAAIADLRARYRRRVESLESRVATAGDRVERERQQATSTRLDTAISLGTTLLSAFLGRKRLSSTTLSRAGSAAKGFGRSSKEAQDVERAETALEGLQASLARLEAELEAEITSLEARYDPTREPLETIELKPRRTDVDVELVALAWLPFEVAEDGSRRWLTRGL